MGAVAAVNGYKGYGEAPKGWDRYTISTKDILGCNTNYKTPWYQIPVDRYVVFVPILPCGVFCAGTRIAVMTPTNESSDCLCIFYELVSYHSRRQLYQTAIPARGGRSSSSATQGCRLI